MTRVAPSILSADFTRLGEEIISIKDSDCDWIHFDVMDGLFVPNITFGIPVLKSVRHFTEMFLDVHLMINNPQNLAAEFCDAGANLLNAHIEATDLDGINSFLRIVKEHDKLSALSIKPSTPLNSIIPFLDRLDMLLIMTVEPGFGGQSFIYETLDKISELNALRNKYNPGLLIEVDGGINPETGKLCVQSGADVLVTGNYFFKSEDRKIASDLLHFNI